MRFKVRYYYCRELHLKEFVRKIDAINYATYLEGIRFVDSVYVHSVDKQFVETLIYSAKRN